MNKPRDIVGNKYGTFTVIKYINTENNGRTYWLCRCDCGLEKVMCRSDIIRKRKCECQLGKSSKHNNALLQRNQASIEEENKRIHGTKYACNKNDYCRLCSLESDTPCATAKMTMQRLRRSFLVAQDISEPYIVGEY